jgi:predicted Zn-dependent protease
MVWAWLGGAMLSGAWAKDTQADSLSMEEQQQFLYYFYEAQRLVQAQEIEAAWELVQFCYELNPQDATVNHYMGVFMNAMEREAEAVPYMKKAFELQPDEYWYNYCLHLLQSNDKKKEKQAIAYLQQVAKRKTKDEEVHDMLQKAYIHTSNYKAALRVQDQLDSILGYNAMSAMQRYRLNAMMKDNEQAVYEVERYLEEDPDNMQFQMFRAQLYEQTKQPPHKMAEAYSALLRFEPRNLMIMNNLAWALCLAQEDLKRAEQLSRTTIMAAPSNPIYLDTYAWIMYTMGDYETALFYIQRAKDNANEETAKEIDEHLKAIQKKLKK